MSSQSNLLKESNTASRSSTEKPNLDTMPSEILLAITQHVEPTERTLVQACLTLCNRKTYASLGSKILDRKILGGTRRTLLEILASDLPGYHFCELCYKLHVTDKSWWPKHTLGLSGKQNTCLERAYEMSFFFLSEYELRLAHVQLAMKRHLYGGAHGIPLNALETTEIFEDNRNPSRVLLSVEARIAKNEILLRTQQYVLVPKGQTNLLRRNYRLIEHLCEHISEMRDSSRIPKLITCALAQNNGEEGTVILHGCSTCGMDFTFESVDLEEHGMAIRIMRWFNLGDGVKPFGQRKFRPHYESLDYYHITTTFKEIPWMDQKQYKAGRVRCAFEAQEGTTLQELTARNEKILLAKQERREFARDSDGRKWQWGGEHLYFNRWFLVGEEDVTTHPKVLEGMQEPLG